MAEAVVSLALETFRDLLSEEARFLTGVGGEVKALETQLKEMKCLLQDADSRRHQNKTISNWIAEIRDLAYKAEDVIETYASQVSSKRGRGLKNLLRRFSCIITDLHSLHQLGSEISQIKSELARVAKSMQDYGIRSIIQGEGSTSTSTAQQWKRQTFPDFQIEDCFVGKEDELKQIVTLALDDNHLHRVVSVWGMAGIGKTTIARKVYNHDDIKRYFQSFAWVCITQECQIRSVLEDVLKQLNPLKRDVIPSLRNTELIEQVSHIQKDKRCIIVLDDLWEIDHWYGLKSAFLVEGVKRKVLVTTRKRKIADIGLSIQLGLLNIDSGWALLQKKAFLGNIADLEIDAKLLGEIGKEMVQKCGFLPLTISLLGGVLSKKKSMREWEMVKQNMNAYLYRGDGLEKGNEIHAVLNLSYEDLPYYLKPCFLYLGLFKEDKAIKAADLYKMWIAHGMISHESREDESLMAIAELYLSELASRSIVQIEVFDEDSMIGKKCKLHDAVREVCLSIGKSEGFGFQYLDYLNGKLIQGFLSSAITRHLAVNFEGENEEQANGGEFAISTDEDTCKFVRSLLLRNGNVKNIEFRDIGIDLQMFKLVRVLYFLRLRFKGRKLPRGIGNLIHLKYLHFDECEVDELPSTIKNLSQLHTLDLGKSWDIGIPNVLNKLLRLKHLMLPLYSDDTAGNYALKLDEGLDELETLVGFDSLVHQLKSITRLKNLQSFKATVHDNESLSAVIDSVTREWKRLKICSVVVKKGCDFTSTEEGLMVLKKVVACPNLNKLFISVKIGKRLEECRSCVSSSRIMCLYLWDCEMEDDPMGLLGKLPVLRILHLWKRSYVGEEMKCSAFSFPCLKELQLKRLPKLREWRVEEAAMPILSEIEINDCPDLTMIPDGLRFYPLFKKSQLRKCQAWKNGFWHQKMVVVVVMEEEEKIPTKSGTCLPLSSTTTKVCISHSCISTKLVS